MDIPDYQSLMLPLLRFLGDKKEHSFRETLNMAKEFNLTEKELRELLPSGKQPIFANRIPGPQVFRIAAHLIPIE